MAYYRLYRLGSPGGRVVGVEEIDAEDDQAALEAAQAFGGDRPLELWCGARKVKAIAAGASVAAKPAVPRTEAAAAPKDHRQGGS